MSDHGSDDLLLTRLKRVVQARLAEERLEGVSADVRVMIDHWADILVGQICFSVWTEEAQRVERSIRYPADWWQAVKERCFPAWATRRWPVVWRTEHVVLKRLATLPRCTLIPPEQRGQVVLKVFEERLTEEGGGQHE